MYKSSHATPEPCQGTLNDNIEVHRLPDPYIGVYIMDVRFKSLECIVSILAYMHTSLCILLFLAGDNGGWVVNLNCHRMEQTLLHQQQ